MIDHTSPVSDLLQAWGRGDTQARDDLLPLVYSELRAQAARYMRRERHDHTLQPTALVHEGYLRLIGQTRISWEFSAGPACPYDVAPDGQRFIVAQAGGLNRDAPINVVLNWMAELKP